MAKFCIQQANIPAVVMKDINEKIEYNNQINQRIDQLEKTLEFEETKIASKLADNSADTSRQANKLMGKKAGKGKSKIANKIVDKTEDRKILKLHEDINTLKSMAKNVTIDDTFIPNRLLHFLLDWKYK